MNEAQQKAADQLIAAIQAALETGYVWAGDKSGWRRATPGERAEAKEALA